MKKTTHSYSIITVAYNILYVYYSKEELGYVCEEAINYSKILINTEDFEKGLDTIQSVQSLDLGAPKVYLQVSLLHCCLL